MDLRIQKTLESIETEFFILRQKYPLQKIRVNDLCEKCRINKSTFYRHYDDILSLSEIIENQLLDKIIQEFSQIDQMFNNPELFIEGLFSSIQKKNEKILILFDGRMNILANKMEKKLKEFYLTKNCTPEQDILISFVIGGASHVFLNPKFEMELYQKEIAQIIRKIKPINA